MNEAYDQELDDDDDDGNVALQLSWRSGLADLLLLCIFTETGLENPCLNQIWILLSRFGLCPPKS